MRSNKKLERDDRFFRRTSRSSVGAELGVFVGPLGFDACIALRHGANVRGWYGIGCRHRHRADSGPRLHSRDNDHEQGQQAAR